jgi:hypothetical protein
LRRATLATAAVSFAALFVAACQLIAGIDELPVGDVSAEGASDAASVDGTTGADACAFACTGPSLPPQPEGGATDDPGTFVVGVSALRLGFMPDGGAAASLNLDCVTSDGTSDLRGCTPHAGGMTLVDDPGGGDNGLYQAFASQKGADFVTKLSPQPFIDDGMTTVLFKVVGYNGQADDPKVSVLAFYSGGHFPSDAYDDAGTLDAAAPVAPPTWGSPPPQWSVDPASAMLSMGSVSAVGSTTAYVSGGILVASFPTMPMPLVGPNDGDPIGGSGNAISALVYVNATTVVLTARISNDPAGTSLYDGHLVGSLSTKAVLSALGPFSDPSSVDASLHDERFCNNPSMGTYPLLKQAICTNADLATSRGNRGSCNTVCDAISIAYGFSAQAVTLAGEATFPVANGKQCSSGQRFNCCDDAGVDAAWIDDCAPDWP